MRIIKALNYYFLADEDEHIAISDYIFFYGTLAFQIIVFVFVLIYLGGR